MPGSLRERRPGVWELRVYLGRDAGGRVRHKQVTFRGGKRAAQRELSRLSAQAEDDDVEEHLNVSKPQPTWGPDTTVNDAIDGWRLNGWEDLSPSTTRRYKSIWKVHIRDSIGKRKIASLGPYDVERYLRELKQQGQSEASVRQIRAMLHRACKLARKWSNNMLPNPVGDTEMPEWQLDERRPEVRSPQADEVRAILAAAWEEDLRVAVFIRLVAATGARRGEISALRWSDVDFDQHRILIDEAIVADVGRAVVRRPKTRASVRALALDEESLQQLNLLREERQLIADACGTQLLDDGFVFSTEPSASQPPHPDAMTHAFSRLRRIVGAAEDIHLHSLRHFQSTVLDSVISEAQKQARLGWATVHMARHYTDAVDEEDRKAATYVAGLLAPAGPAPAKKRAAVRYRTDSSVPDVPTEPPLAIRERQGPPAATQRRASGSGTGR